MFVSSVGDVRCFGRANPVGIPLWRLNAWRSEEEEVLPAVGGEGALGGMDGGVSTRPVGAMTRAIFRLLVSGATEGAAVWVSVPLEADTGRADVRLSSDAMTGAFSSNGPVLFARVEGTESDVSKSSS